MQADILKEGFCLLEKILVVDDETQILEDTKEALELHQYQVTTIQDPHVAMNLVKKDPKYFDLLILDWKLKSDLDGDSLLMAAHLLPTFKSPVVFVTAHTHLASKHLMRLGAQETLRKPFTHDQLIDCVEKWLGKRPQENPHLNAPAEVPPEVLKKRERTYKMLEAAHKCNTRKEMAKYLGISEATLYRWFHLSGLGHIFLSKKP